MIVAGMAAANPRPTTARPTRRSCVPAETNRSRSRSRSYGCTPTRHPGEPERCDPTLRSTCWETPRQYWYRMVDGEGHEEVASQMSVGRMPRPADSEHHAEAAHAHAMASGRVTGRLEEHRATEAHDGPRPWCAMPPAASLNRLFSSPDVPEPRRASAARWAIREPGRPRRRAPRSQGSMSAPR